MRFKQVKPVRSKAAYRLYSQDELTEAYISVKERDISVAKASRMYQVPMQTLRDRVLGKISIDTVTTGRAPALNVEEEDKIVSHLKVVAQYRYGYTRQEVVDIANDYAIQLGKRSKENPLTLSWFVHFAKRWPEIKVLRPRSLEIQRAVSTSSQVLHKYFVQLEEIFNKYDLHDKPHLIFNVDEKGVSQVHAPPYVVAGSECRPQAVTAGKGKTTTIIGCGSASGMAIPPFFVFAGKRLVPDLMKGSTPGAKGVMSDTGWSNSSIFRVYLQEHFIKYVPQRDCDQHLLLLLDGHTSHVSLDLIEWAQTKKIILFILPAHTSHVLQPLDVGCYGPFQRMFHGECHKLTRQSITAVTRHDICQISCKVYGKALSMENLHSSFRKTGIYPLDKSVISLHATTPAEVFIIDDDVVDDDAVPSPPTASTQQEPVISPSAVFSSRLAKLMEQKKSREKRKPRRHIGKVVSGRPISESYVQEEILKYKESDSAKIKAKQRQQTTKKQKKTVVEDRTIPSTSYIYVSESDEMDDVSEDENCCVCKKFTPTEVRDSVSVVFVKWAQCDGIQCQHWVHLKYCTEVTVIRLGDKFYCPHCPADMEEE